MKNIFLYRTNGLAAVTAMIFVALINFINPQLHAQGVICARPLKLFSSGTPVNSIILQGPTTYNSAYTLTLPAAAPALNELLISDASGNLSWGQIGSGNISTGGVSLSNISSTGASTGQIITFDGSNVVWGSAATNTVTHNATLSGNGTAGSPLAVNLGNANTWTANQTFAGTFLIASNSRIALTNSDNNARDVRFQEPSGTGTQYIGWRAPSVTNNGNYVFPAVVGSVGQVLTIASGNSIDSATTAWTSVLSSGASAGGDLTGTYPNPSIASGAISTAKLADGSVSTIKLIDSSVSSAKLQNSAVTLAKISTSGATSGDVISFDGTNAVWSAGGGGSPTGSAGGDLSGSYPNPTIANDAITSAKIADGSITNVDIIAAAGIPYSKLTLTNSVQNADLVANSVTTSKVANGTVTTSKMADSAISGLKLLTFAVTNRHLASSAVTPDKISGAGAANGQTLVFNSGTNTVGWANFRPKFNRVSISNINSPYTVTSTDEIVGVDVTSGPVTVTLPPANSLAAGTIIIVKNELGNAAVNNITIQRNGTDLINAASTQVTISSGTGTGSFSFYTDGVSRWHQF